MGMYVQHNMSSMNANRMLGITTSAQAKSTEKLSSGYRINRAADDAAGLAISEKMRGQIRGLNKASSNAQDGISMIQTAEGALTETHSIIQRMRELAVQSSNDTNTDDDRTQIQNEIDQLTQEVDRIATTTEFNTKKLLDGSRVGSVTEKDGTAKVDSTFGNSTVSAAITTNGSAKADFTDVIRVEITKDFTAGQNTKATSKLSDSDINKLYSMITTSTGVGLDTVLQETAAVSITNGTGFNANNSTEENIEGALAAAKTQLQTLQGNAADSSAAVEKNADVVNKIVDNVMKLNKDIKDTDDNSILKEGVTADDLKKAINDYVAAYVKDGKYTGDVADGTADEIKAAEAALKDLFSTTSTATVGATTAAAVTLGTTTKADNTATGAAIEVAQVAAANTFATVAGNVITSLGTAVTQIAGTQIKDNVNNAKVDQVQNVVDALSDTELSKAIVDYKKAEADYTSIATTGTTAQKEEYQAKVDSAKAALDKLNKGESVLTVTDLFGNSEDTNKFSIAGKVADDGSLTISMKNKSGDDTVITISNADKLKAGDVITITSQEMVESKQAATGNEAFRLQVGANAGQEVALGINSMKAKDLNLVQTKEGVEGKALDVTTQAGASLAVNAYDMALQKVSTERAKMGAVQNRLEHTISNLDTAAENTQNAESRIRDTDMAKEMVEYSKNNILAQAGQSMLAQANQSTQGILSLLG